MKKLIPCLIVALLAVIMLTGCDEEKAKPLPKDGVPDSIKASKKADMEGG